MSLKLIVFDLDGTLVTAEIDFLAMRQVIRDLLIDRGFPPEALSLNSTQDLLRSAFIHANKIGMTTIEMSELRDKIYTVAVEIEWEGAKKAQLVPGVLETFQELKERHINIAILTNDNRQVANYLLEKYKLASYVDMLISREDVPHMKPAPDGLQMILEKFKITVDESLFVGDSTIDIITAKKLGMKCIARLSKVRSEEELQKEGAIAVFPTLEKLIPYLVKQNLLPPKNPSNQRSDQKQL
jgi:HAD superfamily hydrolase (TIGR01509 family)